MADTAYCPPYPRRLSAVTALLRAAWRRDGDLLALLPREAYAMEMGRLGYSRRSILIVNAPEHVRHVLTDPEGVFPKSDLMVGALEPLVGDSIFVSSGELWRRQRRMIDPAFSQLRIKAAFPSMVAAVDACEQRLHDHAASGAPFSLDLAMSHLTADVICRTIFSTSLESEAARDVFDAFTLFERRAAQVEIRRLIMDPAWSAVPQHPDVLDACRRIRLRLGELLDPRLQPGAAPVDDIAGAVIAARDPDTGEGFSREELIDELGVFFLAGHETTASVLTWVFFILATRPEVARRMREEIDAVVGEGEVTLQHVRRLPYVRSVFRETLRLYPPITFLPRVAERATRIGGRRVRRGAMVMISPWTIHRQEGLWSCPNHFDPGRFEGDGEKRVPTGAYLPFGVGPRVCVGADFAGVESSLILARLVRAFDFDVLDPAAVRPVARLTTRPEREIACRVRLRSR